MRAIYKINSVILILTAMVLVAIWVEISSNPFVTQYYISSIVVSGIFSVGMFRTLFFLFNVLLNNFTILKKLILAEQYIEGCWIGFFKSKDNEIRLYCEYFEQSLDNIVIRGNSFYEDGNFHATWKAENVTLNAENGTLNYSYYADPINNSIINPGYASFSLRRKTKYSAPYEMIGYSSDLHDSSKLSSMEYKVKDGNSKDLNDLIILAREYAIKNKNIIFRESV